MDPLDQTAAPDAGMMQPEMAGPPAGPDPMTVAGNHLLMAIQALLSAAPSGPPVPAGPPTGAEPPAPAPPY